MELLGTLEKKIELLVILAKDLKEEKERLLSEAIEFKSRIDHLEQSLLQKSEDFKEWDREKDSVKKTVDELISDIDLLIEGRTVNE